MFFIGIDVGKWNNEVALIDKKGITVGKTVRITNAKIFSNRHHLIISHSFLFPVRLVLVLIHLKPFFSLHFLLT